MFGNTQKAVPASQKLLEQKIANGAETLTTLREAAEEMRYTNDLKSEAKDQEKEIAALSKELGIEIN